MSNTKKPAFNADAAEEYFSDLLFYYKKTGDDIFNRDNEGRHTTNFVYSAEYQKYVGMQIAMREVLEYFSKYDLADVQEILGEDYDLDRLREIVQADREGRCVVLDVKIGQKVWILDAGEYGDDDEAYPLELNINGITLSDEHEIYYFIESPLGMDIDPFSHKDIGKTVFLTRADAEAALRREQDGNRI